MSFIVIWNVIHYVQVFTDGSKDLLIHNTGSAVAIPSQHCMGDRAASAVGSGEKLHSVQNRVGIVRNKSGNRKEEVIMTG